jgi:hypothetical protein
MEVFKRWGVSMPDESVKIYGGLEIVGEIKIKIN